MHAVYIFLRHFHHDSTCYSRILFTTHRGGVTLLVLCLHVCLIAVNATTGTLTWKRSLNTTHNATNMLMVNSYISYDGGFIFFTANDETVNCHNAFTGAEVWSVKVGRNWYSGPAVTAAAVYVCSFDSNCYALDRCSALTPCYVQHIHAWVL